jgi:oligopeptide transport system substrate-binding protein
MHFMVFMVLMAFMRVPFVSRFPVAAPVVLAVALFAASLSAAPAGGGGGREKILNIGNGAEPQDIDPAVTTGVPEARIISTLFEGLVTHAPSGNGVAPGVAERWKTSADGREWTFHLRADARWSNGEPVTAQDFVRTFERTLTPEFGAEYAYFLYHVEGAEAFNNGTLKDFSQTGFSAPVPFLLESLTHHSWMPVPIATVRKAGGLRAKGTAWTRPGRR